MRSIARIGQVLLLLVQLSLISALSAVSSEKIKPIWQTKIKAQETDFIRFLSKDRVLVGTLATSGFGTDWGWYPWPNEIMLLNSETGETVWSAPTKIVGDYETLLATDPAILIHGSTQCMALDPGTGAIIWQREKIGEDSLLLSERGPIIFFGQKKSVVSVSAVNTKTGSEIWKTSIEKYPEMKDSQLEAQRAGDVMLLVGPELTAITLSTGKLLWRMPFGAISGAKSAAITLDDDIYISDGSSLTKTDPNSGKVMWREEFSNRAFDQLTANSQSLFALLRLTGEDSAEEIVALDRSNGKISWKYTLPEPLTSPITTEGRLLYMTTAGNVIAINSADGSVVFSATIPLVLQSQRQLPDILSLRNNRIIVARETGVMSMQKDDGRVLFAEPIIGGSPFTFDYAMNRLRHAVISGELPNKKQETQKNVDIKTADISYRTALSHQRFVYQQTAEVLRTGTGLEKRQALNDRIFAASSTEIALRSSQNQQQIDAASGFAMAVLGLSDALSAAFVELSVRGRMANLRAQINTALQNHQDSLQQNFYIRPRYEHGWGWSLTMINLETGKRADILLSPDTQILAESAANLPAFSIDESGMRIISIGLGLDPSKIEMYKPRTARRMGAWWGKQEVPYPSLLAFDLSKMDFEQGAKSQMVTPKQITPEQKKLNDQLIASAFNSDIGMVKKMLDAGADVNAKDEYGQTALMLAAECLIVYNKKDIIELLIKRGADIAIKDPSGWMAIQHIAIGSWDRRTGPQQKGFKLLDKKK
jgi:outer membrane protein assembly factor BamB